MISKVTKLLIATTNAGKLREVEPLLDRLPIDLLTLADVSRIPPPEESGATFAENARAKALYYANATGHPTVAEDSGLEIDALGGAPGVHSARYGGERSSYPEKFRLIEEALRASGTTDRRARFVCALALANSRGVRFESRGEIVGSIAQQSRGEGGFGYDPIFYYPPFGCTLAEAGDRKSEVSHRAKAFKALREYLMGVNFEL